MKTLLRGGVGFPWACGAAFSLVAVSGNAAIFDLAEGKPAWANSTYSFYTPDRAVDGNMDTGWAASTYGSLASPLWLEVDLQQIFPVDRVVLHGAFNHGQYEGYTTEYQLYVSTDNANWTQKAAGTLYDTAELSLRNADITFDPTDVRYLRFDGVGGMHWIGLVEMEVFSSVAVPEPASFGIVFGAIALGVAARRRAGAIV